MAEKSGARVGPHQVRPGAELAYDDYGWDPRWGVFRQLDLRVQQVYDQAYLSERYAPIEPAVRDLAWHRVKVLEAFSPRHGPLTPRLLDFGCGLGAVVEAARWCGYDSYGCDLVAAGDGRRLTLAEASALTWDVLTAFDSLEHLIDPAGLIRLLSPATCMVSVPECHYPGDDDWFLAWKHRRPGEHLWHFDRGSLARMMDALGYDLVAQSWFEDDWRPRYDPTLANILTAIFRRR